MKKYELDDMDIISIMYDSPALPLLFKRIIDGNISESEAYEILEGVFLSSRERLEDMKREDDYE